jgi:hypothetical protein
MGYRGLDTLGFAKDIHTAIKILTILPTEMLWDYNKG